MEFFVYILHGIRALLVQSTNRNILLQAVLVCNINWIHPEMLHNEWVVYLLITYSSYFKKSLGLKIKAFFFWCAKMGLYVLIIRAIYRDSNFSTRFHPSLAKILFQMEQMVLYTQMKFKGHLWEYPLGDWKTMLSAASLLETLVGLMV